MKKFVPVVLAIAMSMCGCASNSASTSPDGTTGKVESTADDTVKSMPENMQTMIEPADALNSCMIEQNMTYDPENPEFVWKAIFYFAGMYQTDIDDAIVEDSTYSLSSGTIKELAKVLFNGMDTLPAIPDGIDVNVSYDEASDRYTLGRGDRGLSYPEVVSYADNGDGTYTITVNLVDSEDKTIITSGTYTLVENPAPASEYAYMITSVK